MASWTIPRATCIRQCRFKWATSHGGRPHHHVAKCHDANANSNVAILHHTMAATQSPSQASENQDTIALDRKVYLMGYALCRRPPIIAHCFRIADSLWRLGGPWAHFGTTVRGKCSGCDRSLIHVSLKNRSHNNHKSKHKMRLRRKMQHITTETRIIRG